MPMFDPDIPDLSAIPDLRVDAHLCLWDEAPPEARRHPCFPGEERAYLPGHIAPILERSRFDGALLVTAGSGERERIRIAEWCAAPGPILGVVAGWSEDLPDSPAVAGLLDTGRLRGVWIRLPGGVSSKTPPWRQALDYCIRHRSRHRLALEIAPSTSPDTLREAMRIADAAGAVPVVLAHLGGVPEDPALLAPWMEEIRALAERPNVRCKLSAVHSGATQHWPLSQLAALFQFFIEIFGEQRLMYGSDWPYCLPAHSWKACLARFTQALGARTQEFREHLLGGSAIRAYGLSAPAESPAGASPTA